MPLDYSRFQQGVNPFEMAAKGFSDAGGLQQAQQQREIGKQNIDLNRQKIEAYTQAQQKQKQFQGAMAELAKDPTLDNYRRFMLANPQAAEALKAPYQMLNAEQKAANISQSTQVLAAVTSGDDKVARSLIGTMREAAVNAGDDAKAAGLETMLEQLTYNPKAVEFALRGTIVANGDPEKVAENWVKFSENARSAAIQPMLKDKATAEAAKAAVESRFAESVAAADAAEKGFDISAIVTDPGIAKQNKRIATMMRLRDKAKSDAAAQKLQSDIDNAQIDRDKATLEMANEVGTAQLNVDTMMLTIDDLESLGEQEITTMGASFQNVRDAATGTIESRMPTINQDVANFEEAIGTFKSQIFLTQIPKMKGLGALTGPEGARLETAIKSISLRQGSERLKSNISTIKELTTKAQEFLRAKYGDISARTEEAKSRSAKVGVPNAEGLPAGVRSITVVGGN